MVAMSKQVQYISHKRPYDAFTLPSWQQIGACRGISR